VAEEEAATSATSGYDSMVMDCAEQAILIAFSVRLTDSVYVFRIPFDVL